MEKSNMLLQCFCWDMKAQYICTRTGRNMERPPALLRAQIRDVSSSWHLFVYFRFEFDQFRALNTLLTALMILISLLSGTNQID